MTSTQFKRKEFIRAGLTARGTPRIRNQHPELSGLSGREYHTQYMRKQRETDRLSWETTNKYKHNERNNSW